MGSAISVSAYKEEEKPCLKWNDFQENAISAFGTLREDSEFSDVTLACEDGQQVEAHKAILAFSSPFFFTLLRKNKHPHPLIYMRGLKSKDLMAILDFLYYGEANIYQERIDAFLAIAEELKLKGLTGNENRKLESEVKGNHNNKSDSEEKRMKQETLLTNIERFASDNFSGQHEVAQGTIAIPNSEISADIQELDHQISFFMSKGENMIPQGDRLIKATVCTVCGKEGKLSQIKAHQIE